MKTELGTNLYNENAIKEMRDAWELKKPFILAALKKSQLNVVQNILTMLDDVETVHQKGELLFGSC